MKFLLAFTFGVCTVVSFSQDLKPFQDEESGLWGYSKDEGRSFSIDPQFSWAYDFSNHCAIVEKDTLFGLIDRKGQTIASIEYTRIYQRTEDTYYFEKRDSLVGILNIAGDTILPFYLTMYGLSFQFHKKESGFYEQQEGFVVWQNEKMDYVFNDKLLLDFEYDEVEDNTIFFDNDEKLTYLKVRKGDHWSFIDFDNNALFDLPKFDKHITGWPDYSFPVQIVENEGEILFYDLENGKVLKSIVGHKYNEKTEAVIVRVGDKVGLLGPDGKQIYPEGFKDLIKMNSFPELFIACNDKDQWGIVKTNGETQNQFYKLVTDVGHSFHLDGHSYAGSSDAYLVQKDGKMAMYLIDGTMIFPFKYELLGVLRKGYKVAPGDEVMFAGNIGELRLYNFKGELVSDEVFEEIYGIWNYRMKNVVVKHKGEVKFYNLENKTFSKTVSSGYKYQSVKNAYNKWGIVGQDGEIYLPFEYDGMYNGGDDRITIFHKGKEAHIRWDENGIDTENIKWTENKY